LKSLGPPTRAHIFTPAEDLPIDGSSRERDCR